MSSVEDKISLLRYFHDVFLRLGDVEASLKLYFFFFFFFAFLFSLSLSCFRFCYVILFSQCHDE
jgi:hypothetical protein